MNRAEALPTYTCTKCGYRIAFGAPLLPPCPMCRAESWRAETTKETDG